MTKYYKERSLHRNPAFELELPDTPEYSSSFIEDILNCRTLDSNDLKTFNDMKLLQLAWVFDINFLSTFRHIRKRQYLDKTIKIQRHLKDYLEKKCAMD